MAGRGQVSWLPGWSVAPSRGIGVLPSGRRRSARDVLCPVTVAGPRRLLTGLPLTTDRYYAGESIAGAAAGSFDLKFSRYVPWLPDKPRVVAHVDVLDHLIPTRTHRFGDGKARGAFRRGAGFGDESDQDEAEPMPEKLREIDRDPIPAFVSLEPVSNAIMEPIGAFVFDLRQHLLAHAKCGSVQSQAHVFAAGNDSVIVPVASQEPARLLEGDRVAIETGLRGAGKSEVHGPWRHDLADPLHRALGEPNGMACQIDL